MYYETNKANYISRFDTEDSLRLKQLLSTGGLSLYESKRASSQSYVCLADVVRLYSRYLS